MAIQRRRVDGVGQYPRTYPSRLFDMAGDWKNWTFRAAGSSAFDIYQQPGMKYSKLRFIGDGGNIGGALHPRQKASGPNFEYEVHLVVDRGNQSTKVSTLGPGVNCRDRGAGLLPDGIWVVGLHAAATTFLQMFQTDAGVLTGIGLGVGILRSGDVLSLHHIESGGSGTYRASINGKLTLTVGPLTAIHGGHTATDVPGIAGPIVPVDNYFQCGQWWVTGSTTPLV